MLLDRMVIKCGESAIEQTRSFLDKITIERVKECLEQYLKAPVGTPAPTAVYEILTQYKLILHDPIMSLVPDLISLHGESILEKCKKRLMPSLLILISSDKPVIQAFAIRAFNSVDHKISEIEFAPAYHLIKAVVSSIGLYFHSSLLFLIIMFHV